MSIHNMRAVVCILAIFRKNTPLRFIKQKRRTAIPGNASKSKKQLAAILQAL